MIFLGLLGAFFLVAGAGSWILDPTLRDMGIAWVVTGVILLGTVSFMAAAAAKRERILKTGRAGRATILSAEDTGVTVNKNPRVRFRIRIEVEGEAPIEATSAFVVSRISAPRVGDVYEVRFDPKNPNDFVFAPVSSTPSSSPTPATTPSAPSLAEQRLQQLERLVSLRERGAVTQEEFEKAKQMLLADD